MVPYGCRRRVLRVMDTKQPARAPIVERVAGWSARHRKTAVFGWLLLVVVAVAAGHQLGTSNVNSYDPGQAGRAERVLDRPVVQQPASESVLVQGRAAGQTYASDPEMRQAGRQVVAALRALSAAGIPLLLAGTAVISAISLLAIPGHWLPVDSTTSSIVLLVGMAVGIDYSLFYLRRTREERAAGRSTAEALRIAAHTSGRAIVVSGLTVMIALAGLFLTGIDVFTGVAIGTILVVRVAVLGSPTLLPAILSMLGPWTDRGRIPFLGPPRPAGPESQLFRALAHAVVRR